jgi:hypothetical protein
MVRKRGFFLVFIAFLWGPLFYTAAQEETEPDIPIESDWSDIVSSTYSRGDKTFTISLGALFPTVFVGQSGKIDGNVKIGGTGSLSFNYFLNSVFFVGAEISGMFAPTLGKNMVYIIPIGVRVGYQFVLGSFEFPLALMIGMAPERYLENEGYFGFFMKPSASAFWRFNTSWSFGLNTGWWWVPQWTSNKAEDVHGNFVELTLSARYHF